jgi:hypothetical protein
MRPFFRYCGLVAWTAYRHSFSLTQNVLFGLFIAVGVASKMVPALKAELTKAGIDVTGIETALIVLVLIVASRIVLAPYWLYQQQAEVIRKQSLQLKKRLSRKQIREQIGKFMERGKRFIVFIHGNEIIPEAEITAWDDEVKTWLNENLDSSYGARFRNPKINPQAPLGIESPDVRDAWEAVRFRLHNLAEILEEQSG